MNPADLALPAISPSLTAKNLSLSTSAGQKSGKAPVPRIDVEPIYTQLKGALGNQWQDYKAAINAFVLGNLNQSELTWVLQPLLSNAPSVIVSTNPALSPVSIAQLHNQLVICLYANVCRDAPSTEVAPWVVATDKPSSAKNAAAIGASDKAGERLKKEIMALHARDRRRIKTLKADVNGRIDGGLKDMQDYKYELAANPTDDGKTWDVETRRKYLQPLAQETLEFPSLTDMQQRIEPICFDEGLIASTAVVSKACADYMEQAAEAFMKTVLGHLQSHVRSNGNDCIQTAKFKTQLRHEENELERGALQRSGLGLLPVETEMQAKREPIGNSSLHLALELGDAFISQQKFLAEKTRLSHWPTIDSPADIWTAKTADADDMVVDEEPAWRGSSIAEQQIILGVLDDCLALA